MANGESDSRPASRAEALPSWIAISVINPKGQKKDLTRHILSLMSDRNRRKVESAKPGSVGTVYRRTREGRQRAEARFDGISGCLRTPAGGSSRQTVLVVERRKVRTRLLTAREAARLMGVPDDYPLPPRYNDAYHLFGDGLAVPVVSYLERELLRPLVSS